MKAIQMEVFVNGKSICVAGFDEAELGATSVTISNSRRNFGTNEEQEMKIDIGGFLSESKETLRWDQRELSLGDEVTIKIVEGKQISQVKQRTKEDPDQKRKAEEHYLFEMARRLGWRIERAK